jgi:hypothetical protein
VKKWIAALFLVVPLTALVTLAEAAVTVRVYNKDSKEHSLAARCGGSTYEIKVRASTTASYTWQGSAPCEVTLGGETHSFSGGESFTIHDGHIKDVKK